MSVQGPMPLAPLSLGGWIVWEEFVLYEPRWHGRADWVLRRYHKRTPDDTCAFVTTLEQGTTRRRHGSAFLTFRTPERTLPPDPVRPATPSYTERRGG